MKKYRVGGAVRDLLLGKEPKDIDYVVVGSTPEEMKSFGMELVGKDFPVFLWKGEEYALARKERKSGAGHKGFDVDFDTDVTLEEDLSRRDLTINSMAMDDNGKIIDPFGGRKDLERRILRHTSNAFREDPLRILRIARFQARYSDKGFVIAKETMSLISEMIKDDALSELSKERILAEIKKSFEDLHPEVFFLSLRSMGALKTILPEVDALFGIPQPELHHPEIDTGVHTMMCLQQARRLTSDKSVLMAVLLHDIGKGITRKEILPQHIEHEKNGVPLVEDIANRLKFDRKTKDLCLRVCRFHTKGHLAMELKPGTLFKLIKDAGGYGSRESIEKFMIACEADHRGRLSFESREYPQREFLLRIFDSSKKVDSKPLIERGFSGSVLGEKINEERIRMIKKEKTNFKFV